MSQPSWLNTRYFVSALGLIPLTFGCSGPNAVPAPRPTPPESSPATLIPMRDGVRLAASVRLPSTEGKFSTILMRTPYGREAFLPADLPRTCAIVTQDVRGRAESEGIWEPFQNEGNDGYDTVQWIARQPWSDGRVGMVGVSYIAYAEWAAAAEHPPALKCIVSDSSPPDPYQNIPYENGCFLLATNLWYAGIIGKSSAAASPKTRGLNGYATLPIANVDLAVTSARNDVFQKEILMERPEDWRRGETIPGLRNCSVAALLLTGTSDGDRVGTQLRWQARPSFPDQFLVCGPWGHGAPDNMTVGSQKFEDGTAMSVAAIRTRFLLKYLGTVGDSKKAIPRACVYIEGDKNWSVEESWPPQGAVIRHFFATLGQSPGGALLESRPAPAATLGYVYDPTRINILPRLRSNPLDDLSSEPLKEDDLPFGHVLFHGALLAAPLTITGAPKAHIRFSTTAVDTDFFVELFDESPTRTYMPVGQAGKFRARYTVTAGGALLNPGKPYEADIQLWDVSQTLPIGHRLTMMISSDRFPVYARNLNSGEPLATGTHPVVATQTIFLGGNSGTQISVPTAPAKR